MADNAVNKIKSPYRYDFVGSFLRPQVLKDAQVNYQKGSIIKEEIDKIVNEETTKVVAMQKELGYHVITDGEIKRTFWHLDFIWGFEGVEHEVDEKGHEVGGEIVKFDFTFLTGKLKENLIPLFIILNF